MVCRFIGFGLQYMALFGYIYELLYDLVCLLNMQGYPGSMNHHPQIMGSQYLYQENSRISKGTGVFIPQSSQPRRKYKQGKRNSPPSYTSKSNNKQQLVNAKGRVANTPAHTNLSADNYATSYINT